MIHNLHDLPHLLIPRQLLTLKVKIVAQLAEADGTEGEGLLVSLVQLRRAVHETLIVLAMPHREDMAQLMARSLDGTVLYELGHFGIEHTCWLVGVLGKVWMMSCITLNANTPALLSHTEHEGPAVLRVQVCVGQDKQALVLSQLHIIL